MLAPGSAATESTLLPLSNSADVCPVSGGKGDLGALWPAEDPCALQGGTSYSSSLPWPTVSKRLHQRQTNEYGWSRDGAVVRSTCLPPMWPRLDSQTLHHMWVEFVVGSHPCSERFFSGYSGFPLATKTNISKFQFNLDSVPN